MMKWALTRYSHWRSDRAVREIRAAGEHRQLIEAQFLIAAQERELKVLRRRLTDMATRNGLTPADIPPARMFDGAHGVWVDTPSK